MRLNWPNLTWRKDSWPDKTYRARSGAYTYCIDHDGTSWRLRAWFAHAPINLGDPTIRTAAQLQRIADDHAAAHTKP
ncbi:hypothetical protein [Streptomyces sp. NPDC001404]|uniref:hypothetical protein n=1 Tax=Streptomyces sp. NPDC001404 TaxID=3364571 RepID=UPI0036A1FBFD